MKYERECGPYNYYVVVTNKHNNVELVHPSQLRESDKVIFETINKQQWYDFSLYCNVNHNIEPISFKGSPEEIEALWNEFNKL